MSDGWRQAYPTFRDCRLATFYSRSRKGRWCKGETSGHFIKVRPGMVGYVVIDVLHTLGKNLLACVWMCANFPL